MSGPVAPSGPKVLSFPTQPNSLGGATDVERINPYALYQLGRTLYQLRRTEDTDANAAYRTLNSGRHACQRLKDGHPLPLTISAGPLKNLLTQIEGVMDWTYFERDEQGKFIQDESGRKKLKIPDKGQVTIESWEWTHITTALDRFETVFLEEMREAATYYVPRRGIFSTKHLVDAADEAFPKEMLPYIPNKTRDDWKAAGRCLAFSLLSASGFHVARAVEGTLEIYYQYFCGRQAGETLKSWHDYVVALKAQRKSGAAPTPAEKIIAEIEQMKDDYRNPIAHPRIVLSEVDARMLFDNGESLILGMAQDLCIAQKNQAPALSLVGALAGITQ